MDDIQALKRQLGFLMENAADGVGALDRRDTPQSWKCIKDFREASSELVYNLLKRITQFYVGSVQVDWPGCPEFIVMDDEEGWASWVRTEFVEKGCA